MKKYIIGFIIILVLFVMFYPVDKKIDLLGEWKMEHLIIDGKDLFEKPKDGMYEVEPFDFFKSNFVYTESFRIERDSFVLQSFNLIDSINYQGIVIGKIDIVNNDTLIISSTSKSLLDSKYSVLIDTVLNKKTSPPEIDINVKLTSSDKEIQFTKHEIVGKRNKWLRSIRPIIRGRGAP